MEFTDTGFRLYEIERFRKSLRIGDALRIRCMVPSLGGVSAIAKHCTCRVAEIYPHVVLLTRKTKKGKIMKECMDYVKLVRENPRLMKRDLPEVALEEGEGQWSSGWK